MLLKGEKISFKYNNTERYIFKDLDFEINSGEIVGLVAPSGFGKTTLAKILSGYEKQYSGKVTIDGEEFKKNGYNQIQLIFQHPEKAVNPKWRMDKIVNEAFEPSQDLLNEMGIKKEWMNRWPSELSGGELQRFCVVRALSNDTKFLIADEMTTMLDAITQAQIWNVVLEYVKKQNIGLIVISHEKALIDRLCDRIVNLDEFKAIV
ncbi:ABC transporter ATP-binding protein [Romboutsia sp.]|uniref:ABC transporter ATP-binding protein n=1 Tax=Romboutsia sp. TaxID=1965302 RepID=UPI003F3E1B9D